MPRAVAYVFEISIGFKDGLVAMESPWSGRSPKTSWPNCCYQQPVPLCAVKRRPRATFRHRAPAGDWERTIQVCVYPSTRHSRTL